MGNIKADVFFCSITKARTIAEFFGLKLIPKDFNMIPQKTREFLSPHFAEAGQKMIEEYVSWPSFSLLGTNKIFVMMIEGQKIVIPSLWWEIGRQYSFVNFGDECIGLLLSAAYMAAEQNKKEEHLQFPYIKSIALKSLPAYFAFQCARIYDNLNPNWIPEQNSQNMEAVTDVVKGEMEENPILERLVKYIEGGELWGSSPFKTRNEISLHAGWQDAVGFTPMKNSEFWQTHIVPIIKKDLAKFKPLA